MAALEFDAIGETDDDGWVTFEVRSGQERIDTAAELRLKFVA